MSDQNSKIKSEPITMADNESLGKINIKTEPNVQSEGQTSSNSDDPKLSTNKPNTPQPNAAAARKFVPNLVNRVKKETPVEETDKKERNKSNRRTPGPNLNAARGRGARGQSNLIQSASIFEAGPAESTKRFGRENPNENSTRVIGTSSSSSHHESGSSSLKREPTHETRIKIEESLLIEDTKEENESIYVTLKKDFRENYDDSKTTDKKATFEKDIKEKVILNNMFEQNNLSRDNLLLFQIPENLQLQELGEGKIGKLRIRRSGAVELVLNDNASLNVSLSVCGDILQDAVALDINPEIKGETGSLRELGHVTNKVVCIPNFI